MTTNHGDPRIVIIPKHKDDILLPTDFLNCLRERVLLALRNAPHEIPPQEEVVVLIEDKGNGIINWEVTVRARIGEDSSNELN